MRNWPDRNAKWSQEDLHAYIEQLGITVDSNEVIPQGVKYVMLRRKS